MPATRFWKDVLELVPDLVPDLLPDLVQNLKPDLVPDLLPHLILDLVSDLVPDLLADLVPELVPDCGASYCSQILIISELATRFCYSSTRIWYQSLLPDSGTRFGNR